VTLNLAETSIAKSRPSVPHGANFVAYAVDVCLSVHLSVTSKCSVKTCLHANSTAW